MTKPMQLLLDELAHGTHLERDGLKHDADSLHELATLAERIDGQEWLAKRLRWHANRVDSLLARARQQPSHFWKL